MSYPTLPGPVIPYHIDGTVVVVMGIDGAHQATLSSAQMIELNDTDYTEVQFSSDQQDEMYIVLFFPEKRNIVGLFTVALDGNGHDGPISVEGSNDTTNGLDGTWESATASSGWNNGTHNADSWRKNEVSGEGWKPMSFTNAKETIRIRIPDGFFYTACLILHLYGSKGTGETEDDLVFLDAEDSDNEFTIPLDYGDRPAGTTVVRQVKVQNVSPDLTANTIEINCVHDHFTIGTSPTGPWLTQIVISSLGPGVKSSIIYVKNSPGVSATLGVYRTPIWATVDSWS